MTQTNHQTMELLEKLDEVSQATLLNFARFLVAENRSDVALYDSVKENDDGYRISSKDLRAKYGL